MAYALDKLVLKGDMSPVQLDIAVRHIVRCGFAGAYVCGPLPRPGVYVTCPWLTPVPRLPPTSATRRHEKQILENFKEAWGYMCENRPQTHVSWVLGERGSGGTEGGAPSAARSSWRDSEHAFYPCPLLSSLLDSPPHFSI